MASCRVELLEGYKDWAGIYTPKSREPAIHDGLVWILLQTGHVAVCDEEDFSKVQGHVWTARVRIRSGHMDRISANAKIAGKNAQLHRHILNPPDDKLVDHISLDVLDNRRTNLRLADSTQNKQNGRKYRGSAVGYKGVSIQNGVYVASIRIDTQLKYLGQYKTAEAAAAAYNRAAQEYFGDFARLNDVPTLDVGAGQHRYMNKSGYKGVYPSGAKYHASIWMSGRLLYIGRYDTPEEAALAYNKAALEHFGPSAKLNVIK